MESQLFSFLIGLVSVAIVALVGSHIWVLRELARVSEHLNHHENALKNLWEKVS
jgi:flagellar biogenesis protein FliO